MTPNPAFPARPAGPLRQRLEAFWRWWSAEISALVPERFSAMRGGAHSPLLSLEGDDAVLVEGRGNAQSGEKAALAGLDETQRRLAVRTLLERAGETRARARLVLGAGEALVRRVTLPAATEENLVQVLAFEMDRLTPFKSSEVYFDFRVMSRNAATSQMVVLLAVARREGIDALLAKARGLGINPQGVAIRDDPAGGPRLDLLPQGMPGEHETSGEGMLRWSLIALVAILLLVALLLPSWQKREAIVGLHPILSKSKQDAEATAAIERDLERQVADYNFVAGKKLAAYPAGAVIEEVTKLLPDNTWVQTLDIKTAGKVREVQLSGETASSSKLIELMESSPLFKNAAPRGTIVRGATPNTERFVIAAELRPRQSTEARPAAAAK